MTRHGPTRYRPTLVEVDLGAVRHNLGLLRPTSAEVMAVVKGDGYGHGDVAVARAAVEAGASWLGVALVEEGLGLRAAGIEAPILVLSELPPGSEPDALRAGLTPSLYTERGLDGLVAATGAVDAPVRAHVKVDTGMHRVGVHPPEATLDLVRRATAAGLELEGLWTHFASADEDEATTREQLVRFLDVAKGLEAEGFVPRVRHAANTAATIRFPETHLDLVRLGIGLYGIRPAPRLGRDLDLRPALTWRSAVTMVKRVPAGDALSYGHRYRLDRDATIATVPVGYEDGYLRALSSRADVLIRGRRHRVAGSVTMDQLMVDCGDETVEPGDDVVLIGRQGDVEVTAEELAGLLGSIAYEVVTTIGERVPREYRG